MERNCRLKVQCPCCGHYSYVDVNEDDYNSYKNGALAQNAFPYLTIEERESLISGLCTSCQERIFKDFEED